MHNQTQQMADDISAEGGLGCAPLDLHRGGFRIHDSAERTETAGALVSQQVCVCQTFTLAPHRTGVERHPIDDLYAEVQAT